MNKPLLYDLYDQIRTDRQWISPGLDEYYLLFTLLNSPDYPLDSFDRVAFALETIWLKSHNQKEKFRKMLEERRVAILNLAEAFKIDGITTVVNESQKIETVEEKNEPVKEADKNTIPEKANSDSKPTKSNITNSPNNDMTLVSDDAGSAVFSIGKSETSNSGTINFNPDSPIAKPLLETPYLFTNDYFPVRNRQLQQAWRGLKNKLEGADGMDMNIERTITATAKQGYFSAFKYQKKVENKLKLFVLLDQSETMIATESFGEELCDTAKQSELHTTLQSWYFYKLPETSTSNDDYIVRNDIWTETSSLRKLFSRLNKKDIVVLIYSDAGALQNELDPERCEKTKKFLRHLYQHTGYIAWVNPAPKKRWANTNAELILEEVPMFETNRADIENAIAALKGKLTVHSK